MMNKKSFHFKKKETCEKVNTRKTIKGKLHKKNNFTLVFPFLFTANSSVVTEESDITTSKGKRKPSRKRVLAYF